jgi:polyisoprenyl-phosphate glycosyltransferase
MKKLISFVIPIYNEEKNLEHLFNSLNELLLLVSKNYDYELVLVDDGSSDSSWKVISDFSERNKFVKAICFSRNFGHQVALSAGYDICSGDAIISLDADLQDPPSLCLDMIKKWGDGAKIVYARRIDRKENFLKKYTALCFYKVLDSVSDVKIPRNVGDFRLIDKIVLDHLKRCNEKNKYLRGIVAWLGFKQDFVDFKRPNRFAGKTHYTWTKMFKLAFDGITGFSLFPLKLSAYVGSFVILTGSLLLVYVTFDAIFFQTYYPLFKWLVIVIYIFMGVQFVLLWLLGEYLGRVYEQEKGRPLYIVSKKINC